MKEKSLESTRDIIYIISVSLSAITLGFMLTLDNLKLNIALQGLIFVIGTVVVVLDRILEERWTQIFLRRGFYLLWFATFIMNICRL